MLFLPSLACLGKARKSLLMHIYVILALFGMLGGRPGKQLLCIFTLFSPSLTLAFRWPPEVHFELFRAPVPEWLSDGLWRLILSNSCLWCQNGSQIASGGSFCVVLGSGARMTPRWPLEAHFKLFWALVAKWFPGGLQRLPGDTRQMRHDR